MFEDEGVCKKICNFCTRDFNNQQAIFKCLFFNVGECFYEGEVIFSISDNK